MESKMCALMVASVLCLTLGSTVDASIILNTDFAGTTEAGATLNGISWTTLGVTSPSSSATVVNTVTQTGNGDLFTTNQADGFFAVNNNTGNGGAWNFETDFTTLGDAIILDDFELDYRNFGGNGGFQFAIRNSNYTFDIIDTTTGTSAIGGALTQQSANINTGPAGTQTETFNVAGIQLAANTTYTLFVGAADATTGGNNVGFDAFTLNGTVVETQSIPEPSSLAVFGIAGLLFARRRRN